MLGKTVKVTVDRPLGSKHPKYDMIYPVNYGYVEGLIGGDGEEQDVYILGIDEPLTEFEGTIIAIVHRLNDNEDKWVVTPDGMRFSKREIKEILYFQEQYFESEIIA
ncbi:MAG: inorganic pyrophosphatase [Clostridia bacterium]|nr:inorganic pyrophosphatase [Clostridia bacterium]